MTVHFACLLAASLVMVTLVQAGAAYGHGLGLDTFSSMADGKKISVAIEMSPDPDRVERQLTITATDRESGNGVRDVTFFMNVIHGGETILSDHFFAESGALAIKLRPSDSVAVEILGQQEGQLNAWRATGGQSLEISGPIFLKSGLYTFEMEIKTVGDTTIVLEDSEISRADLTIVGTTEHLEEDARGNDIRFQLKSYFDAVQNFNYDPVAGTITFEMPFDWNDRVISHVPVVHAEVHFPKDFSEYYSPGYTGTINGIELFKSSIAVDDYTDEHERIVHFVLLNDHIRFLKNQLKQSGEIPDYMVFTLSTSDDNPFPITAYTAGEEFSVDLSWDPAEIVPGQTVDFIFTIRDGITGSPLRNSIYDFVLFQNNQEIHRVHNEVQIGGGFEKFTFSEEQTGPVTIKFENIRGTGAETKFVAVVVPEFGTVAALILLVAMTSAIVVSMRFTPRLQRA